MGLLEHVQLKNGTVVPVVVCSAAMSTLRVIQADTPQTLVRIVRCGGDVSRGLLTEADTQYLGSLGLLDQAGSLPEEFLAVLLSAVTVETGEPVIGNPVRK